EQNDRTGGHVKYDMVVTALFAAVEVKRTRFLRACRPNHAKRTGHPEMHDEHVAGLKIAQQIFCATSEPGHQLTIEAFGEVSLKGKAQVAAPRLDPHDTVTFHDRLQAATNSLNFGQFRHRCLENRMIWWSPD